MLQGRYPKPNLKMKSSKAQRKEAGSSFFKQDGTFFKTDKSHQKNKKQTGSNTKDKTKQPVKSVIGTALDAPASFETKDRLVSSVQSYMALFCSLGDAGMSLSTSVHSVLSEIGFTEIAGQFSKGFNEINDISMATFNEMKDFVEKVVDAWEAQSDGKSLTTQSVLQVLAYLLKTQLNFLQTASEHISEVLHTQYSGKTMLELLGGEAFFLTPPSTPTKTVTLPQPKSPATSTAVSTSVTATTHNEGAKQPPNGVLSSKSDSEPSTQRHGSSHSGGVVKEKSKPINQPVNKSPSDSVHSIDSEASSKTTSDESTNRTPPSDVELNNIIDLLSGSSLNQSHTNPANHINPSVPTQASQFASFLYPASANSYAINSNSQASQMLSHNVFIHNMERAEQRVPYDVTSALVLDPRNSNRLDESAYAAAILEAQGHQPLAHRVSLDSALQNKTVKTNTWPMRPGRGECNSAQQMAPAYQPCGATAADLEFSQYVNAVQRRTARAGGSIGSRGSIDNPWSAGDSAMAWPPFGVNFDSQERKQWPNEDSSNCSDESSSNNGGDWMVGPELLSVMGSRDQQMAAKDAFNKAAWSEARTTNTWPLKQPFVGRNLVGNRETQAQVYNPCLDSEYMAASSSHLPLGVSLSEPQGFAKNWQTAQY